MRVRKLRPGLSRMQQRMGVNANVIVGCVVIAGALSFLTYAVLWSRRSIDRIARRGFGSVREIDRELQSDR